MTSESTLPKAAEAVADQPAHVLWTGGWDSSFRVLQLITENERPVQPHYIADPSRPSTKRELDAIKEISESIWQEFDPSLLRRTKVTNLHEIKIPQSAKQAHEQLAKKFFIGEQYLWLGEYAHQQEIDQIELCIHIDDKAYAVVAPSFDDLFASKAPEPFDRFHLPILELSKEKMMKIATEKGFYHILTLSWFCHNPTLSGQPCGICNPCRWTAEEGLAHRLPLSAKLRSIADRYCISQLPSFRLRRFLRRRLRGYQ